MRRFVNNLLVRFDKFFKILDILYLVIRKLGFTFSITLISRIQFLGSFQMNSRAVKFYGMSGSASPSSYETGSTNSTIDDSYFDGVSSTTGKTSRSSRSSNNSRYKTELCRSFGEQGRCKYGSKCQFAHGLGELREVARHPRYKTELCKRFHATGFCSYGTRCHFVHDLPALATDSSSTEVKKSAKVEAFAAQHPGVSSTTPFDAEFSQIASTPWLTSVCETPPGFGRTSGSSNRRDLQFETMISMARIGQLARQNVDGGSSYDCQLGVDVRIQQLLLSLRSMGGTQLPFMGIHRGY